MILARVKIGGCSGSGNDRERKRRKDGKGGATIREVGGRDVVGLSERASLTLPVSSGSLPRCLVALASCHLAASLDLSG